ncbi:hypothetical protein ScPMuIL_013031 [Solemya velum]
MERNLKRTEQTLTRIYDDTVQLLTKANNVEVVSKAYDLKEEIGEILGTDLSLPSRGAAYDAKFVAGTIDFDILREMCGEIVMPAVTGLGAVGRSGDHAAKTISKPAGTGLGAVGGSGAHTTKKMPQYGDGQDGQGAAANSGPSKTKMSGQMSPTRTHKFSVTGRIFDIHTTPDDRAWICGGEVTGHPCLLKVVAESCCSITGFGVEDQISSEEDPRQVESG